MSGIKYQITDNRNLPNGCKKEEGKRKPWLAISLLLPSAFLLFYSIYT